MKLSLALLAIIVGIFITGYFWFRKIAVSWKEKDEYDPQKDFI